MSVTVVTIQNYHSTKYIPYAVYPILAHIVDNWQFGPLSLLHLLHPVPPTVVLSLFSTSVRLFLFCFAF